MENVSDSNVEQEAETVAEIQPEPEQEFGIETEVSAEMKLEAEPEPEPETKPVGLTEEEVLQLMDSYPEAAEPVEDAAPEEAVATEEEAEYLSVATDFEMEEEALAKLEEDIDPAAEEIPAPAELVEGGEQPVAEGMEAPEQEDPITLDEIVGDAEIMETAEAGSDDGFQFEDVSAATLEFEQEEDAATGMDDLPEVVRIAAAAAQNPEMSMDAPEQAPVEPDTQCVDAVAEGSDVSEMSTETDEEAGSAADEAQAIAAIAEAIEAESNADNPTPPDIRSLLLRVEALAKKAEAMRQGQEGAPHSALEPETEAETAEAPD